MISPRSRRVLAFLAAALLPAASAWCGAPQAYKWSVQYLIDNSQPVFGRSQEVFPRINRALAISPDGNFLYAGYIHSFNQGAELTARSSRMTNQGEVRKIDLRVADYEDATRQVLLYHRAKALAVDNDGHVYMADGKTIDIYDSDLQKSLLSIDTDDCNGVATAREGGDNVLYATERDKGELHRYIIDTRFLSGGAKATPAGFGGNGVVAIDGAKSLRGVTVDSKGRIWMADEIANKVFRVDASGTNQVSADVPNAVDIAIYDDTALVTRGKDSQIAIVSPDMTVTGNLSIPWEELELAPYGNNRSGGLAGIVVIPGSKGFYVANEDGQTAHQKSTYGRTDANSQIIGGKLYTDALQDDNEPILRAVPVEVQDVSPSPTP